MLFQVKAYSMKKDVYFTFYIKAETAKQAQQENAILTNMLNKLLDKDVISSLHFIQEGSQAFKQHHFKPYLVLHKNAITGLYSGRVEHGSSLLMDVK